MCIRDRGKVHYKLPTLLEIDTARMEADGDTIWHAGVTVYLVESVDPEYITQISNDHPEYEVARARWVDEEE